MDRRKLQSKNILHKQLYSSSQLPIKTMGDFTKNNILARSISAVDSQPFSRKRKNSEDEDKDLSNVSSTNFVNTRKKKCNIFDSDDEEKIEEEISPVRLRTANLNRKQKKGDRFSKRDESEESNSNCKLSSNSEKDENNEQNNSTSGSYIRGMLEALDKSPSKLSQNSNTSIDKYRKLNVRTSIRSKLQRVASKTVVERYKEKVCKSQKYEESHDDLQIEKSDLKSKLVQSRFKKKNDVNKYLDLDNSMIQKEILSFDTDDSLIKKAITVPKDKSTLEVFNETVKDKSQNKIYTSPAEKSINKINKSFKLSPKNDKIISINKIDYVNIQKKKSNDETNNKFTGFLNAVGINLYLGDNLHVATDDPREIILKMKKLLSSNSFELDEIIKYWNNYIDDEENLKKSLLEMKIEIDEGIEICLKGLSLSRLLLQVSELQDQIFDSLFKKLIDAVITSDSSDDVPWALQMLQQFRFLEILVNPDFLIKKIEELLSSSPEWFQREVIVFIPDIVVDTHHHETAEMLTKIMKNNSDLTNIILDCIHNLILSMDYKEELRENILKLLENNIDLNILPAITRFVLDTCATEAIALKSLNALRVVDMTISAKNKIDECYTNQMFIVNAIKTNMQLFKEVSQAAFTVSKTCSSEAVPLDFILSILLYETMTVKKKMMETIIFSHIKDNYYKTSLLNVLYTGYKQVAKSFQSTALNLAISLLRSDNSVLVEFGIEWLRNIFISQSDTSYKQREILERLLNLMGNKDRTVKNALEVLCRMANDEKECQYFQQHAAFLRCFLEKIDYLQFDEVAVLYHLLHGMCTQSQLISNLLNDDLNIIMHKQLYSSKVLTKCKGVLGAVMAIKHLATNNETSDQAFQLLKKTLNSLKSCIKSQTLFYDQLGQVIINNDNVNDQFLSDVTNFFEDSFVSKCLVECNSDKTLVPKFGLNDPTMAESYYVNFGSGKAGVFVSAFFKLLRICNLRLTGSLESINAVLGCSILMPEDLNMPEASTADYMIHCINWFREIIGGFAMQKETLLREQVLKRLRRLMILQGEFAMLLLMCENSYHPPPCYFHRFPIPEFIKLDMKLGKKGNKKKKKNGQKKNIEEDEIDSNLNNSVLLPEWENWVLGSELTIKNPTYFRQMDTKIINLLDTNMDPQSSQTSENITTAQICFIVKEFLDTFEYQASEHLVRDLIKLLPKICDKLKIIISDLRKSESADKKEAVRLILCFLTSLFSWKEFKNAKYNILLRDGLRTLAKMTNESSALLRSCKDLVAAAYTYFETLADIATQISIAVAIVNMCNCLMKHSVSFLEQYKEKQAKMAFGFLSLEWNNEIQNPQYKAAIKELLKMWLDNEPDPLETVNSILKGLAEEAASLDSPKSHLTRLSCINRMNFHLLIKQLFIGLIKGVDLSLSLTETDPERIRIWLEVAVCLEKISNICKMKKNNVYLVIFLRYTTILYQILLSTGMSLLEMNIKYQAEEVLNVIKLFQKIGRFLRDIFCTARKNKNVSLLKLIPNAKLKREKFIYRVKGMLTANNARAAFWMGNLLNKDLDGEEIATQSSEDITTTSELTNENNTANETESECFNSDSDEETDNTE